MTQESTVIMERLATDFPEPLSTLFYTVGYSQRMELIPTSEKVYEFPEGTSLERIAGDFQQILRSASVPFKIEPSTIDADVEWVKLVYFQGYDYASDELRRGMRLLDGAIGVLLHQNGGKEI
tara:strand:- start:93 stop:458 length:366 start_codon:yes stop_codon:yes gene_type:complete